MQDWGNLGVAYADACMYRDDYWGAKNDANGDTTGTTATTNETAAPNLNQAATGAPMEPVLQRGDDGDIDMAE